MSVWGDPLILGQAKPDYSGATIEQGSISSTDGQNSTASQAARLRTAGYIPIDDTCKYVIDCNILRVYVHYYTASKAFMSGDSVGWLTPLPTTITPPSGAKFMRFVLSNSTSGSVSPSSVTYFTVDQRVVDL